MEPSELRKLDYNGISMSYRVSGSGEPVVLMHGWGCSGKTVEFIEKICADSGYKVFNVDFPGFGDSDEPDEVWGVEEYTKIIEGLSKEENIIKPVLIGHSFGGRVAVLFGSRNNTGKIILIDAAGIRPRRSIKYYFKVYRFKVWKKFMKLVMKGSSYETWLDKYRRKKGSADYAAASPKMRQILSKVVNEDLKKVMPMIKAPTLLIWGRNDTATPIRDARVMNKLIPDSGLVEFEDAGHYSFLDQPVRFKAVLSNFLKS